MVLGRAVSRVLEFCYPATCARCDGDCQSGGVLCDACMVELAGQERVPACRFCAMPLPAHDSPCPHCHGQGMSHLEQVRRLGTFEGPIQRLVHQMKYRSRWTLGEFLADRLFEQPGVATLLQECDCVVPVPLHWFRQIVRGFNQAEVIAARLATRAGRPLLKPVVRVRATGSQTRLSVQERARNVHDAFGLVSPRNVAGARVVLVDDVMTTGATLRSVARTIQPAKPASISAIVVAIADPKHRGFEVI